MVSYTAIIPLLFYLLCMLGSPSPIFAKIPDPPNVIYGTVTYEGALVRTGQVTLVISGQIETIASYEIGSSSALGSRYRLVVPLDCLEPQAPLTARPGDTAHILYNGKKAATITIRNPGSLRQINLSVTNPPPPRSTFLPHLILLLD